MWLGYFLVMSQGLSSHPQVFYQKAVLDCFTGKHLCESLLRKLQVQAYNFSKNIFSQLSFSVNFAIFTEQQP